ncbi:hypothetical protein NLG97_g8186 [Lecanicillium saksenae]|uniref:Uncharacterized protein n=1 Tax=Lecanicillium saksenae TaxID=468837 RepID=A0ACC1QJQ1_9HYPO|nr:hypothetical protein NLG97_g8186 [Lecanicillium saksenae]
MHSFADHRDGFVLPNARFNPTTQPPSCSGLLTPPESPKTSNAPLPTCTSTSKLASLNEFLPRSCYSPSEPERQSAEHDLSRVSETIYTIIEQVIEQKLAEAMGPLRLNVRRLDSESLEFHEQNDTLGSEVKRLEQYRNAINTQLHTLQNISTATSNNLELLSSLSNQLSHATAAMQNHSPCASSYSASGLASPISQHHPRLCHGTVQPQFCFESRSSKRQRRSRTKSKRSRLVNYVLSKWRSGGVDRD